MAFIARALAKIVLIFFLVSCSHEVKRSEGEDYVKYVDEIVYNFRKKIRREKGLVAYGDGGSMPTDVESISVSLHLPRKMGIEEARKIEVEATEELANMVNEHKLIRPFLRNFPFDSRRTEVSLSYFPKSYSEDLSSTISFVHPAKGRIFYYSRESPEAKLKLIFSEPYEEAYKIVYGE